MFIWLIRRRPEGHVTRAAAGLRVLFAYVVAVAVGGQDGSQRVPDVLLESLGRTLRERVHARSLAAGAKQAERIRRRVPQSARGRVVRSPRSCPVGSLG